MKNVVTALNNPILNDMMNNDKDLNILTSDIQYQEGIFEIIEKNKNIEYLILSEILPGENDIKKLIQKIKKKNDIIKIVIILENKDEELENYLYAKGIFKIFYNNQVEINEIINLIKNDYNENEKIIKELEDLKNILIKNNIKINSQENLISLNEENEKKKKTNKIIKIIKNIFKKKIFKINNKKIISLLGTGGVR